MPHQCVRCNTVYPNNSPELMRGCTCGSRVFLFLRSGADAPKAEEKPDMRWIEDELAFLSKDKPVSVDIDGVENLRILEKGSYELDLPSLMKGEPLVI
ncbi:MAG: Zn-ribbon containing protein, partial [Candidatus Micrarchaeota archaeon]|nr:Zn-ribbon containing protein [Candidatus Micrarchaeota archaeon]